MVAWRSRYVRSYALPQCATGQRSTSSSSSSEQHGLLEVGRLAKPHGLRGEVVVELTTERTERVVAGSILRTATGQTIAIRASRPHHGRWIASIEGVADRTAAEALRGERLFAEPIDDPNELFAHELIGAEVVDVAGKPCGRVEAIQANPAADLLVLEDASLVPVVFVVERRADGTVVIDPPPGLLELGPEG